VIDSWNFTGAFQGPGMKMTRKISSPNNPDGYKPNIYEYELPGGWKVLVGKSDEDNDYLSLKMARPDDYWFHVKGTSGSHVIMRTKPREEPDRETLKLAASIAAFHSKFRKGGVVPVSCTKVRYVKKPRDARPGTVHIRKESVLKVRPGVMTI
jgi:predicted ribosome quality control (RQC) complex YloA/Tae2 family protein